MYLYALINQYATFLVLCKNEKYKIKYTKT